MKKIYFAGSIRGGRDDSQLYISIIEILSNYGQVLTEHIADKSLTTMGETTNTNEYIHDRDLDWLNQADFIVAEVTTPSLGVGYEIAKAEDADKKILCIYREIEGRRISAMLSGSQKLTSKSYSELSDLKPILEEFLT